MFESWAIVGPYPSWWLFNSLLLVLQVLHIIWSYLIARIALKAMLRGKVSEQEVQGSDDMMGGAAICQIRNTDATLKKKNSCHFMAVKHS